VPSPQLAVIGNLSRDLVDGGPPRTGGAPYWAGRGLRALGLPALLAVKCAEADRELLAPALLELRLPVLWLESSSTAAFSYRYAGDRREMTVDALGDAWSPEDARFVGPGGWVHVGALARSDFPAATLAELASGRVVSLDGQGLVRPARTGRLELDSDYDPGVLRHVSILKLAEEEARVLVGDPSHQALASLGVAEVVVTLGSRGSLVLAGGRLEQVDAERVDGEVDPTGAGDAFAAAYLAARSRGVEPLGAAREATALVGRLLRS
jgi:sugar/nucleoside kinase (ribokinase family)